MINPLTQIPIVQQSMFISGSTDLARKHFEMTSCPSLFSIFCTFTFLRSFFWETEPEFPILMAQNKKVKAKNLAIVIRFLWLIITSSIKFYKKIRDVKGQLISKCPFGIFVWTKLPTKLVLDFCPEFFL